MGTGVEDKDDSVLVVSELGSLQLEDVEEVEKDSGDGEEIGICSESVEEEEKMGRGGEDKDEMGVKSKWVTEDGCVVVEEGK